MITQEYLHEAIHYCPDTGIITWRKKRPLSHFKSAGARRGWLSRFSGLIAGSTDGNGYIVIWLRGKCYRAHRLAYLYMYGAFPTETIDHINSDRADNRIENLRDVTHQENLKNQRMNRNNTSGCMGVSFFKAAGKWYAQIGEGSTRKRLGCFVEFDDAVAARKQAEVQYGYHENHGRLRLRIEVEKLDGMEDIS